MDVPKKIALLQLFKMHPIVVFNAVAPTCTLTPAFQLNATRNNWHYWQLLFIQELGVTSTGLCSILQ
jgi:hypothetical protein